MRTFKSALTGKGLLAASIALLSGGALAETAGRVSFVSGNVTASLPDGSTRQLQRGDIISGGDKINTLTGRIQIRFTDGGFISLQPNTVFGVDEYLYSNRKPEETSLFFSLLQGGMRTITGAIGKVNKQSYKVRTPVATIGIRGTTYLASLNSRGLLVSVGAGLVNVGNDGGSVTGGAGQNIFAPLGGVPALSDERAQVRARDIVEEVREFALTESEDDTVHSSIVLSNLLDENGIPIVLDLGLVATSLPDTDTSLSPVAPIYNLSYCNTSFCNTGGIINPASGVGIVATFDQDGSVTGSRGALLTAFNNSEGPNLIADQLPIHYNGVTTVGSLSWGEFTDGSLLDFGQTITLSNTEFLPYIIGLPSVSNLASGKASYSLNGGGGTTPRSSNGGSGTLNAFNITIDLDMATIAAALNVSMGSSTYNVATASPVVLSNLGTAADFYLDSSILTVNGAACNSGINCANINGFFAGAGASQIGAAYQIQTGGADGTITGVAGLVLGSFHSGPASAAPNGPGYTAAIASSAGGSGSSATYGGYGFGTGFNDGSLTNTFDTSGLLDKAEDSFGADVLARNGAAADSTGRHGNLNWGRWFSPAGHIVTVGGSPATLATHEAVHYITGPMTYNNLFGALSGASAVYEYRGGTSATRTGGTDTGTLSGSINVNFGFSPTLDIALHVDMNTGSDYTMGTSAGGIGLSSNAQFTGNLTCSNSGGGSGCSTTVDGFFAGGQAQQIGLAYLINDFNDGSKTTGVGAFDQTVFTPAPPSNP